MCHRTKVTGTLTEWRTLLRSTWFVSGKLLQIGGSRRPLQLAEARRKREGIRLAPFGESYTQSYSCHRSSHTPSTPKRHTIARPLTPDKMSTKETAVWHKILTGYWETNDGPIEVYIPVWKGSSDNWSMLGLQVQWQLEYLGGYGSSGNWSI